MRQNAATSPVMARRARGDGSPSGARDIVRQQAPKPMKNAMRRARWYHSLSMPGSKNELRMSMAKKQAQKSAMPPTMVRSMVADTL